MAVTTGRILHLTWGNPRARERNRTADLRITSALLCRLSYSGLYCYEAGLRSWPPIAHRGSKPAGDLWETIGKGEAVRGETEQRGDDV